MGVKCGRLLLGIMLNSATAFLFLSLPVLQDCKTLFPLLTTRNITRYYDEDPPHYPKEIIEELLQSFPSVPGLFYGVKTKDRELHVSDIVYHNNFDEKLERFKKK